MARDPGDLYQVSPDAPEFDDVPMLYYLDGFIDAGGAGRLLTAHLLSTLEHTEVARFDVDSLIDYRSRRPVMTFAKDHWEHYDAPEISVSLLHDDGRDPVPAAERPGAGPRLGLVHQRTAHAGHDAAGEARGRVPRHPDGRAAHQAARRHRARDPHRAGRGLPAAGRPAAGARQRGSPARAADGRGGAGSDRVRRARAALPGPGGLSRRPRSPCSIRCSAQPAWPCPADALREAAHRTDLEIARQVEGSDEVSEVVQALEQQYDAFAAGSDGGMLAEEPENMPTAEELGAQFERFLAEQQGRGDNPEA